MHQLALIFLSGLLLLSGCQSLPSQSGKTTEIEETLQTALTKTDENARANAFFEQAFAETLSRSPMHQSYLGIKDQQDSWDDLSEQRAWEDLDVNIRQLASLKSSIDRKKLNE